MRKGTTTPAAGHILARGRGGAGEHDGLAARVFACRASKEGWTAGATIVRP